MKRIVFGRNIASAVCITVLLLYFMEKAPTYKFVFVPFLISSISMLGENIALYAGNKKTAKAFHKLFAVGFFLFWFGFLIAAAYLCLRDKHYQMILFSIPFWIIGFYFAKKRLRK